MKNTVNKKAVGARIRKIRLEKGMTLEEFGKLMGADKGIVSRWENGTSIPKAERLKTVAKLGDMTVEELLNGSSMSFNTLKKYLEYDPKAVQLKLETVIDELIKKWFMSNNDYDYYLELDRYKHTYAIRLFGRLVLFTITEPDIACIENEFERWEEARKVNSKKISDYIFKEMQEKDTAYPQNFITELNLINVNLDYSVPIFEFILEALEEISKENKNLIGFILNEKIGDMIGEVNRFLYDKNYSGIGITQNGAYKDPEAIINSIDYEVYKGIQEHLASTVAYITQNLTDNFD